MALCSFHFLSVDQRVVLSLSTGVHVRGVIVSLSDLGIGIVAVSVLGSPTMPQDFTGLFDVVFGPKPKRLALQSQPVMLPERTFCVMPWSSVVIVQSTSLTEAEEKRLLEDLDPIQKGWRPEFVEAGIADGITLNCECGVDVQFDRIEGCDDVAELEIGVSGEMTIIANLDADRARYLAYCLLNFADGKPFV